jgi:hypothetical protein
LKTRFYEIRRPRSAPGEAFGGIEIKKYLARSAPEASLSYRRTLIELYFGAEIHTRIQPATWQDSNERATEN